MDNKKNQAIKDEKVKESGADKKIADKQIKAQAGQTKDETPDFSNFKVNKKGFIEVDGEVVETLPSITFRVVLENDQEITARLSGRMRMYRIMLLPGDKVKVEMSPYDLTKGRIVYRY